jgi:hypothetical protein
VARFGLRKVNKMRSIPTTPAVPGPQLSAASTSVTLASDQVLPLPAGAATAANQTTASTALTAIQASVAAGATANNQTTAIAALNLIQTSTAASATAAKQPGLNADGGALSHVTNFPAIQPISASALPLPAGAAQDGTDATGVTPPVGGSGIRGWLSGIFNLLSGSLKVIPNVAGAAVSNTNPLPVTASVSVSFPSGSTGLDYSSNKPAIPNVGAAFASTSLYPSYVLVATVPASSTRSNVDIENISGGQIVVVRDDGTISAGSAPANASAFALGGGASAGAQGGSWSSTTFKGRLQIYAPSATAAVTIMVD